MYIYLLVYTLTYLFTYILCFCLFIYFCQAGGKASTGSGNILDVVPQDLHEHVPCLMGSIHDVTEAEKYIKMIR